MSQLVEILGVNEACGLDYTELKSEGKSVFLPYQSVGISSKSKEKELASDYASNLSMFLGDGLLQNLTEWTGNSIPSLGDVTFTDGVTPVVYFNQLDERYASQPYGTDNIGGYGCGPTAMSIVVSSLTDETVDPVAMAQWSYENGYWCKSSGSYHALIPAAAEAWGLPVSGCTTSEPQRILDALAEGKLVVRLWQRAILLHPGILSFSVA